MPIPLYVLLLPSNYVHHCFLFIFTVNLACHHSFPIVFVVKFCLSSPPVLICRYFMPLDLFSCILTMIIICSSSLPCHFCYKFLFINLSLFHYRCKDSHHPFPCLVCSMLVSITLSPMILRCFAFMTLSIVVLNCFSTSSSPTTFISLCLCNLIYVSIVLCLVFCCTFSFLSFVSLYIDVSILLLLLYHRIHHHLYRCADIFDLLW